MNEGKNIDEYTIHVRKNYSLGGEPRWEAYVEEVVFIAAIGSTMGETLERLTAKVEAAYQAAESTGN